MKALLASLTVLGMVVWLSGCGSGSGDVSSSEQRQAFSELQGDPDEVATMPSGGGGGDGTGGGSVDGTGSGRGEGTGGGQTGDRISHGGGEGPGTGMGPGRTGGRGRNGGPGGGTGVGRPHRRLPPRWRSMDTKPDDMLERDSEFTGVPEEFDRVDTNGDGYLLPEEIQPAKALHVALAEQFEHFDPDADGQVTSQEWSAAFAAFDADSNGLVVPDELRKAANKELAAVTLGYFSHFDRTSPDQQQDEPRPDQAISGPEWMSIFEEVDRIDPDGHMVSAELAAGVGLRRRLGLGVRSGPLRGMPARFRAMDTDEDEAVSSDEFKGGPEEFARLDRDGDSKLSVEEITRSVPTVFVLIYRMDLFDTSKNGSIEIGEWNQVFAVIDAEADKKVSRDELRNELATGQSDAAPQRGLLAKTVLAHFTHFDRDRDDSITAEEWTGEFEVLDRAEPKGHLTPDKLRAAVRWHAVLEKIKERSDDAS